MSSRQQSIPPLAKLVQESSRIRQQIVDLFRPSPEKLLLRSDVDLTPLRNHYRKSALAKEADTFCLWRIIGNDLVPRHRKGQSRDNVAFILDHETELQDCTKHWLLNRIFDSDEQAAIIELLDRYDQPYHCIPFDLSEYARQSWDLEGLPDSAFSVSESSAKPGPGQRIDARVRRLKNNYAINNNGARNAALSLGRSLAKWVLPWDGNCFLTAEAWAAIREDVRRQPFLPYFMVPMTRTTANRELLRPEFAPKPTEEPQIIFRKDAAETFDERFPYGRRPKVELLWRLDVRGPWDRSPMEPGDLPKPALSPDAGYYARAGWVARLESGRPDLEVYRKSWKHRGGVRDEAIVAFLDGLDRRFLERHLDRTALAFYDEKKLRAVAQGSLPEFKESLRARAEEALSRGPYSVTDKTTLPPSGDPHDYWHPAPYWWPDPNKANGRPYVRRDGHRVPGTELYEPGSEQFDRTRLQRLFDDTTALALAWRVLGDERFINHAANLIRTWFIDPRTRMEPHLRYAQVRRGHNNDEGASTGIIEMKDLYFFLDAVRIVVGADALNTEEDAALQVWFQEYATWLAKSEQGTAEMHQVNNHGTLYDVQVAAVAAFLGDAPTLVATLRRAQERILQQFAPDGAQPNELRRVNTRHYCCFNLQGWTSLSRLLSSSCGYDLWNYTTGDGRGVRPAMEWLFDSLGTGSWPYPDQGTFDRRRLQPLVWDYKRLYAEPDTYGVLSAELEPPKLVFHPHDGIAPFWALASDYNVK
ncbi:MAG: alginate lyase family protein [Filomicrobium sp.]